MIPILAIGNMTMMMMIYKDTENNIYNNNTNTALLLLLLVILLLLILARCYYCHCCCYNCFYCYPTTTTTITIIKKRCQRRLVTASPIKTKIARPSPKEPCMFGIAFKSAINPLIYSITRHRHARGSLVFPPRTPPEAPRSAAAIPIPNNAEDGRLISVF